MKKALAAIFLFALAVPAAALCAAGGEGSSPRFVATYFYTNVRCPSCLTIERLTSETIQAEFADEIRDGVLQWRTVNVDGEGNFHFVKDYQLYSKSVIISEVDQGREVRWKNLVKVWELLRSEKKFRSYIESEVRQFMEQP